VKTTIVYNGVTNQTATVIKCILGQKLHTVTSLICEVHATRVNLQWLRTNGHFYDCSVQIRHWNNKGTTRRKEQDTVHIWCMASLTACCTTRTELAPSSEICYNSYTDSTQLHVYIWVKNSIVIILHKMRCVLTYWTCMYAFSALNI